MKIPLNWLRDYAALNLPVAELAERLTLAGLEVSGVRLLGLPAPDGLRVSIRRSKTDQEWHGGRDRYSSRGDSLSGGCAEKHRCKSPTSPRGRCSGLSPRASAERETDRP